VPRSEPEGSTAAGPLRIARVAVEGAPLHLGDTLDYLAPEGLRVGHRVELSLAGRRTRGLVVGLADDSEVPRARLRPVGRLLGDTPWTDTDGVGVLAWAAGRFGAPLGDVVRHALPNRVIDEERRAAAAGWWPPGDGIDRARATSAAESDVPAEAGHRAVDWSHYGDAGHALSAAAAAGTGSFLLSPLPGEDLAGLVADLARRTLAGGRDVLVVVSGPVSEVADRVLAEVVEDARVDLRGGPSPRPGYRAWLRARAGIARVVVGERSAAFTPLARLGLAVVVDEADPTHKERRSPRHHVREVLLERARRAQAVGLCTSDVPSAVARALVADGRLTSVTPMRSLVEQCRPVVRLETGELEARARISRSGMRVLRDAVAAGGYGVVLAARRGEGRALVCGRCGDLLRCTRCSASVARSRDGGWWCAACGQTSARAPRCDRCGPGPLSPLAAGAQRFGQELARAIDAPVAVLEGHAPPVPPAPAVLVMTRGSVLDRPPVGGPVLGVVLPDLDGSLRRPTLDSAEDALRLAFRVAGWTVMGERHAGTDAAVPDVVVETRDPDHHALRALAAWDAEAFWEAEAALRAPLGLPPHRWAMRIEGPDSQALVRSVRGHVAPGDAVVGPLPLDGARMALLVLSDDRSATLAALRPLREEQSRRGGDLRLEVDPVDLG
jgi:primosomal protein N' (replication factor Y) (superfamily II helicase)